MGRLSNVPVKARNTEDIDTLTVIMISDTLRGPEEHAFPDSDDRGDKLAAIIIEPKPNENDYYCSNGHYSKPSAFGMITNRKTGKQYHDHYCRQCRAEQQRRWRATQKQDRAGEALTG